MCLTPKPKMIPSFPTASSKSHFVSIETEPMEKMNNNSKPSLKRSREQVRRPSVRFLDTPVAGIVTSISSISREECDDAWYSDNELAGFKNEIRALCKKNLDYEHISRNPDISDTTSATCEMDTRGIEQRICKNRQQNKFLALWGTLKAQQRNNDPEFIAAVARKCSVLATELAIMEGARDYCEVYEPDKVGLLLSRIKSFELSPFPIKLKRKSPSPSSYSTPITMTHICDRNLRRRFN